MAKTLLEELTNYREWQMEKYGNIVSDIESTPAGELMNSGLDELNRLAEWVFHQSKHDHLFTADLPDIASVDKLNERKDQYGKIIYLPRNTRYKQNKRV